MLVVLVTESQGVGEEGRQAEVSDLEAEATVHHAIGGAKSAMVVHRRVVQELHGLSSRSKHHSVST